MRTLLLALLFANLMLLGYQQGYFGRAPQQGREPERLARQIEPDKIRLVTDARAVRDNGTAAPETTQTAEAPACLQLGDFSAEMAARVRRRLDALNLGERLAAVEVEAPGWFVVYLPPFETRQAADRAAYELRKRGVTDLMVIGDNSPLRNAVSLGSFKDRDLALKHQTDVENRGIKGARVSERATPTGVMLTRFRVKGVDTALTQQLSALQSDFAPSRLAPCEP